MITRTAPIGPKPHDPLGYLHWLRAFPRSQYVCLTNPDDYTNVLRSQALFGPIVTDAVDRFILQCDRSVVTNYDLWAARQLRRLGLDLELTAALLLAEALDEWTHPGERWTEPIPY